MHKHLAFQPGLTLDRLASIVDPVAVLRTPSAPYRSVGSAIFSEDLAVSAVTMLISPVSGFTYGPVVTRHAWVYQL